MGGGLSTKNMAYLSEYLSLDVGLFCIIIRRINQLRRDSICGTQFSSGENLAKKNLLMAKITFQYFSLIFSEELDSL